MERQRFGIRSGLTETSPDRAQRVGTWPVLGARDHRDPEQTPVLAEASSGHDKRRPPLAGRSIRIGKRHADDIALLKPLHWPSGRQRRPLSEGAERVLGSALDDFRQNNPDAVDLIGELIAFRETQGRANGLWNRGLRFACQLAGDHGAFCGITE